MFSTLNNGDTAWMLVCSALVFLMVPGIALFYGGLASQKNFQPILTQAVLAICLVNLQWLLLGYSLSFGPDHNGWIGTLAWAGLRGVGTDPNLEYAGSIPHLAFVMYHAMVACFAPAILLGISAGRMKLSSFCIFTLLWTSLVYDPIAHWMWNVGGFLRNSGASDFAGGAVVLLAAGVSSSALALVLGKSRTVTASEPPASATPFPVLGAILLWFGWFGFTGGHAWSSGVMAAGTLIATQTAAVVGGLVWSALDGLYAKQVSLLGLLTGVIIGLVAVSSAAGTVDTSGALAIGFGATTLVYVSFVLLEKWLGYSDSLFLGCVFGIGGVFGLLCSGPFLVQARAALAVSIYAFGMSYLMLKAVDYLIGLEDSQKTNPEL